MITIFTMLVSLLSQISYATDTITQPTSIRDGSSLISKDGSFELGFFSPGSSSNRYVGLWYKNIPVRRVVWVLNRDNPIKDDSSKLTISQDGNLMLLNQNESLVWWSTNISTNASNRVVQLLDNGNLVLKDVINSDNGESFLWQGFDYPCDTLLPGMKIGIDKRTGLNRHLTAWKNWEDPSSGDLKNVVEFTSNPEGIFWKGSTKYYRTGPLIGAESRGSVGLRDNPIYGFEYSVNENEVYYMFILKNASLISAGVLNQTLSVRQRLLWIPESRTWNVYQSLPIDNCDVYNVCGANGYCIIEGSQTCRCLDGFKPKSLELWNSLDWKQGCVRNGNWSCGVKNRDGFRKFIGMKFPDTTNSWINANMTLDECKVKCINNCSCTAYTSLDPVGAGKGCSIWLGDLIDLRISQDGQDLYVRMDSAYIDKIMMIKEKDEDGHDDFELPIFELATVLKATNNFSNDNKLGEGGFGPVYKGTLQDGQVIAVKRLSKNSVQGSIEFKNEVILCAKLQHRNLVKVIGCCIEGDEKMLLYEYMPNRSLDLFIFDPVQSRFLDWPVRFNMLNAIARGLLYLHQDSILRIIHRDLKASNILVDNDMNPKISDFGMARMCGGDQIEGKTSRIVGTYGYMAPEYVIHRLFSIKSDVFSFGVLLLEIISGRRNRALTYHEHDHNLIWHAWRLWREDIPHELIDECLRDSCILHEALRCIQVGLLCVQHVPNDRPNMTTVVMMLGSEITLPQPKEPGFLNQRVSIEETSSSSREEIPSINGITISRLNAR
ncbi:S-locus lectin kinase family protein [Medicago truncatula]|uniref:Receptor-like serine/threonine-protein kinase n=1 Tax=Medicago truncatula TaxID=3880 RepID=G7JZD9_MEDTR|nr:S-locus lectin kinase family protein [Medicago truncatula]